MSLDSLTPEERKVIENAFKVLKNVENHRILLDRSNAQIYLAQVRWSPMTKAVMRAAKALHDLLSGVSPEAYTEEESVGQTLEGPVHDPDRYPE